MNFASIDILSEENINNFYDELISSSHRIDFIKCDNGRRGYIDLGIDYNYNCGSLPWLNVGYCEYGYYWQVANICSTGRGYGCTTSCT